MTAKCEGVGEEERRRGGLIPDSRIGILQLRATVDEKRRVNTEFGDRDLTVTRLTKAKEVEKTY